MIQALTIFRPIFGSIILVTPTTLSKGDHAQGSQKVQSHTVTDHTFFCEGSLVICPDASDLCYSGFQGTLVICLLKQSQG